jgi:pentapeptide repeat protein
VPASCSASTRNHAKRPVRSGFMDDDDDVPKFRVRVVGRGRIPPRTRVWWPKRGGRYEGHPSVRFDAVTVRGVDFRGVHFDNFESEGTRFVRCDFSGARIEGFLGVRRQTTFEDCRFEKTRLREAQPNQSRFVRCEFADADLWGWSTVAAEFVECRFSGKLQRCKFWGAPWGEWLEPGNLRPVRMTNEFRANDFSQAELEDVGFVGGIDLDQQRLPTGPQYVRLDHSQERIARVRSIVARWEAGADRNEALLLLDAYSGDEVEAQDDLFANRWETDVPRQVATRVWALLEGVTLI